MTVVDPSFAVSGAEWQLAPAAAEPAAAPSGAGFSDALGKAVGALEADQAKATEAAQSLATGTATDQTAAVMALERARLSMQFASTVRTKAVDAFSELMRTQV